MPADVEEVTLIAFTAPVLGDECQSSATTISCAVMLKGRPPLSAVSKQYWITKTD